MCCPIEELLNRVPIPRVVQILTLNGFPQGTRLIVVLLHYQKDVLLSLGFGVLCAQVVNSIFGTAL